MKKVILTIAALGAGTGLVFSPVAQAGEKKSDKDKLEWFAEADTDNDSNLTMAEFKAAKGDKMDDEKLKEKFAKMDADNDGNVTVDECKAKYDKKKHDKRDKHDKDKADDDAAE